MSTLSHRSAARSIPARSVQAALLLCCLVPASTNAKDAASTRPGDDRGTIVEAAGGRLQFTQRGSELILPTPDGKATTSIELPGRWIVESAARVGDVTWISGRSNDASIDDMFVARVHSEGHIELLPTPTGREHPRGGTSLLIQRGKLVGITWLEGTSQTSASVRAAPWNGGDWGTVEWVSPPRGTEQTLLRSVVLDDDSWLAVWAAVDTDDDIWWSRRDGTRWSEPRRLHTDNQVPDIFPHAIAFGNSALVVWTSFDGNDYKLRQARLENETWLEEPIVSGRGAQPVILVELETGPAALASSVIPEVWSLINLGAEERPNGCLQTPILDGQTRRHGEPLVAEHNGTPWLRWPAIEAGADATEVEMTIAPDQP